LFNQKGPQDIDTGNQTLRPLQFKLWPHLLQNMATDGKEYPHWGHCISSLPPHLRQKFEPSGFSNRHFEHFIFNTAQRRNRN